MSSLGASKPKTDRVFDVRFINAADHGDGHVLRKEPDFEFVAVGERPVCPIRSNRSWTSSKADEVAEWVKARTSASSLGSRSKQVAQQSRDAIYAPLGNPNVIRVLELQAGTQDTNIVGHLHHCSLEFDYPARAISRSPLKTSAAYRSNLNNHALSIKDLSVPVFYTAVSYTWGTQIFDASMQCNGHPLAITKSLEVALRRFRRADRHISLWVDQICINQRDDKEKSCQVPLMSKIYQRAWNTILWLGESTQDLSETVELLEYFSDGNLNLPRPQDLEGLGRPPIDTAPWMGLCDLLCRAWFTRLWVVQEAVLSGYPSFMCGEHIFHFDTLAEFSQRLEGTPLLEALKALSINRNGTSGNKDTSSWSAAGLMATLRDSAQGIAPSAMTVLPLIRHTRCYHSRDKVYGILGLIDVDKKDIVVDYSESHSVGQVYHDIAMLDIRTSPVKIQSYLASVDHDPETTDPSLPSWVPDWSRPRDTASLSHDTLHNDLYGAWRVPVSGGTEFYRPVFDHDPSKKALEVTVKKMGKLVHLHPPCVDPRLDIVDPWKRNIELLDLVCVFSHMPLERYKGRIFDTFWRTLVADQVGDGRTRAPESFAEVFSLVCDETTRKTPTFSDQTYTARQLRPPGRGRLDLKSLQSRKPAETLAEVRVALQSALHHRSLGFTDTGHVGLFPRYARDGDFVCVFRGFSVPYVIRSRPDGGYTFIGECHVHGVMHNELADDADLVEERAVLI